MLPIFSMVPCRRSPSWSLLTPAGVPVVIRSPGRSVKQLAEKADMLAQAADHVAGVRGHRFFAVLQNLDRKILRLFNFITRHDPRPQTR